MCMKLQHEIPVSEEKNLATNILKQEQTLIAFWTPVISSYSTYAKQISISCTKVEQSLNPNFADVKQKFVPVIKKASRKEQTFRVLIATPSRLSLPNFLNSSSISDGAIVVGTFLTYTDFTSTADNRENMKQEQGHWRWWPFNYTRSWGHHTFMKNRKYELVITFIFKSWGFFEMLHHRPFNSICWCNGWLTRGFCYMLPLWGWGWSLVKGLRGSCLVSLPLPLPLPFCNL